MIVWSALSIAAARADEAAFLIDQQVTAIGALPSQVLGQPVVLQFRFTIITSGVFFQHAGDGISTGENRLAFVPCDGWTTYTTELPYYLSNIYPRPQRQGNKAAGSFKLSSGAATSLTQGGEDLAYSLLIRVYGYIEITATGGYPFGNP